MAFEVGEQALEGYLEIYAHIPRFVSRKTMEIYSGVVNRMYV